MAQHPSRSVVVALLLLGSVTSCYEGGHDPNDPKESILPRTQVIPQFEALAERLRARAPKAGPIFDHKITLICKDVRKAIFDAYRLAPPLSEQSQSELDIAITACEGSPRRGAAYLLKVYEREVQIDDAPKPAAG